MTWLAMQFDDAVDSDGSSWDDLTVEPITAYQCLPSVARFAGLSYGHPFSPDMAAGACVDDLIDNIDAVLESYRR